MPLFTRYISLFTLSPPGVSGVGLYRLMGSDQPGVKIYSGITGICFKHLNLTLILVPFENASSLEAGRCSSSPELHLLGFMDNRGASSGALDLRGLMYNSKGSLNGVGAQSIAQII